MMKKKETEKLASIRSWLQGALEYIDEGRPEDARVHIEEAMREAKP